MDWGERKSSVFKLFFELLKAEISFWLFLAILRVVLDAIGDSLVVIDVELHF